MYILASSSPRRKELLKEIIPNFEIIPANIDEDITYATPYDLPLKLSFIKAIEIFKTHPDDTVIAADTVVIYDEQVLGKPKDKEDAKRMLRLLSGNMHKVVTGYTIFSKSKFVHKKVITKVYFNNLSDNLINEYVNTGSPLDKAGAYGIQDKDFKLVNHIEGSYSNVVGLPIDSLKKEL